MRTPDALPPPQVDGWTLSHVLGVGGSARVWQAVPVGGGAPAAVKVLTLAEGALPIAAAGEAAVLSGLDHPHLIRLVEAVPVRTPGSGRPGIALVLELADGGSLADLLRRRGRLAPGEVVTAVAPVATALAHVHDRGFVHGDVTPANLLFDREGVPHLADLGVASVVGGYGEVSTTAAYADPVVAAGGRPAPASDVFMLAATAYHALTGVPPWPDPLPAVALARAVQADLGPLRARLAGVPAPMVEVLLDALRPDAHLRPSAAAFALDFGRSARAVAVDFDAGRAERRPGDPPRWTATVPPTGARETLGVDPLAPREPPPPPAPRRRRRGPFGPRPALRPGPGSESGSSAPSAPRPGSGARPEPDRVRRARARPVGRHATAVRRNHRRWVVGALTLPAAAVVALVVAVLGGVVGGDDRQAAARPVSARPADGWQSVLDTLDSRRAAAFAAGDAAALREVYAAPGLLAADTATLAAKVPAGCGLQGARTTYLDVRGPPGAVPATAPGPVALQVTASLAGSVLRCPGQVAVAVDGLPASPLTVTLVRVDGRWLIGGQELG